MKNNIQLCYASKRNPTENTLIDDIREILVKSRQNNTQAGICGVLYYAKGFYFQCLQGDLELVHCLYNNIAGDDRHNEIRIIQEKNINEPSFNEWSMKYVQEDTALNQFFIDNKMAFFNPLIISDDLIDDFLEVVLVAPDKKVFQKLKSGYMNRGYSNYF